IFVIQAEDGIRDFHVTGVQTCALPISGEVYLHNGEWKFSAIGQSVSGDLGELCRQFNLELPAEAFLKKAQAVKTETPSAKSAPRSEERRVGKECRSKR